MQRLGGVGIGRYGSEHDRGAGHEVREGVLESSLRDDHVAEILDRLRRWLDSSGCGGIVLSEPGGVAWATGGMNPAIDRSSATDLLWAVVGRRQQAIITTVVERVRVEQDFAPAAHGFELIAVPWFGESQFVDAAVRFLGRPAETLATDGHPAFGVQAHEAVVRARLAHTILARAELRRLGAETAAAIEQALSTWVPGEVDRAIQARIVGELELRGAEAVTAIVSGDVRVERFRHPMAAGVPLQRLAMAVIVARRGGLHVAATRIACAGGVDPELAARLALVRRVESAVLEECIPGSTYGRAALALGHGYAAIGQPLAWQEHYQGGPIGYAGREFEFAPAERGSRWWNCPIEVGHAVAWNPSLAGGAKVEDTFLVGLEGLECITPPGEWPTEVAGPSPGVQRAAVLYVS